MDNWLRRLIAYAHLLWFPLIVHKGVLLFAFSHWCFILAVVGRGSFIGGLLCVDCSSVLWAFWFAVSDLLFGDFVCGCHSSTSRWCVSVVCYQRCTHTCGNLFACTFSMRFCTRGQCCWDCSVAEPETDLFEADWRFRDVAACSNLRERQCELLCYRMSGSAWSFHICRGNHGNRSCVLCLEGELFASRLMMQYCLWSLDGHTSHSSMNKMECLSKMSVDQLKGDWCVV